MVAEFTIAEFSGCPIFRCQVYRCPLYRESTTHMLQQTYDHTHATRDLRPHTHANRPTTTCATAENINALSSNTFKYWTVSEGTWKPRISSQKFYTKVSSQIDIQLMLLDLRSLCFHRLRHANRVKHSSCTVGHGKQHPAWEISVQKHRRFI